MPEYLAKLTIGEIVIFLAGIALIAGVVMKIWKPVRRAFRSVEKFLIAWHGTNEVLDGSGAVIQPKVPGVIAQISVLRDQLENSHQDAAIPNLRDDLDTKASKEDVKAIAELLASMSAKLTEHIEISKSKDAEQEETARQVSLLASKYVDTE